MSCLDEHDLKWARLSCFKSLWGVSCLQLLCQVFGRLA